MPKKIFELAKELDMGPLDLVEELKSKGYNVRNHMTSLEDSEVDEIVALYKKKEEPAPAAKKVKKVRKKSTVKKKATTKKAEVKAAEDSEEAPKKKAAKKSVVRKKTVVRRKASSDSAETKTAGDSVEAEAKSEAVENTKQESVSLSDAIGIETESKAPSSVQAQEDDSSGLRIVSRPESTPTEEQVEAAAEQSDDEDSKEIYKEKVHKFTPVYIPPAKSEDDSDSDEKGRFAGSDEQSGTATDDDKKADSKKRIGGLASMVSGKKNVTRSQVLNQTRADNELKSYQALSGTGRPIYTQVKRKKIYTGPSKETNITEVKESKRIVKIHGHSTGVGLAKKLKVKLKDMVDKCLDLNLLVKGEDYIGLTLANEIAALYDYKVVDIAFNEDEVLGKENLTEDQKSDLPLRDPIITIMGHVDHGKTTLLDYIRKAKVASGEAGGITQHIGAYSVDVGQSRLTFLDTPGHAAFASMRQRGANVTDVVVLVVAADDGVMPQTKESVRFCENAGVPVIVAVNKMDKEGVNPDRVKQELVELNLTPEDWGGDTQFVNISALKGTGVDELLEAIALQAEVLELRANPKGNVEGIVIESKVEQGRGPVATILVQSGTLKKGNSIVVGETFGRARSLTDHAGKQVNEAGPSVPVQILGLNEAPSPGDIMNVSKNEREARKIADNRATERKKLASEPAKQKISLEDFFAQAVDQGVEQKELCLLVRTDVQGSYEAIKQSLESLSNKEVSVRLIGGGVGPISDSDVMLAENAAGFILGFNMRPSTSARRLAEDSGVDVKTYSVIYELIDDVRKAVEGLLDPEYIEEFSGRAEVRDTFVVPKIGTIAGSLVIDGKMQKGCKIRLLRNGKILFDGNLSSLKRFKDDVKEVKNGYECGIGLEEYTDIKVGDIFEAYMLVERKRTLQDVEKAEAAAAAAAETESAEQTTL
jgi:translation initiation factor IF-2